MARSPFIYLAVIGGLSRGRDWVWVLAASRLDLGRHRYIWSCRPAWYRSAALMTADVVGVWLAFFTWVAMVAGLWLRVR